MKYEIHINYLNLLASQPDFLNQKPLLQEIIESYGHKIIFYPHVPLNQIHKFAVKKYRSHPVLKICHVTIYTNLDVHIIDLKK